MSMACKPQGSRDHPPFELVFELGLALGFELGFVLGLGLGLGLGVITWLLQNAHHFRGSYEALRLQRVPPTTMVIRLRERRKGWRPLSVQKGLLAKLTK